MLAAAGYLVRSATLESRAIKPSIARGVPQSSCLSVQQQRQWFMMLLGWCSSGYQSTYGRR